MGIGLFYDENGWAHWAVLYDDERGQEEERNSAEAVNQVIRALNN